MISTPAAPSPLTFIRQDVQGMHAYAVQDSRGMTKLDAMENPYTLPAELQAKLGERLGAVAINRYPVFPVEALHTALKAYVGLPANYALMLGNGSDELISLLAMACLTAKDKPQNTILAPLPGFVMYEMSAQLQGLDFLGVPLTKDFELDEAAMLAAIDAHKPAITYIAYPNNPTANLWNADIIKKIIAASKSYGGLVVMDEAYQPFSSKTWLSEIRADPFANSHVLLMRTLSKFGLAGVRLGYMLGTQSLIDQIDKLRPPYNISSLNAEAGMFALEHQDVFDAQAANIRQERTRLMAGLAAISGVTPFPSEANMILVRVPDADVAFTKLKSKGILIKNISKMHPLLANCLRLTVGTPDENNTLLSALQ
ncbi:MAG: histidinol-phosphate transaminase [Cytophagales bacterium]|nr:histidinol-phosphate transaminase [Cytophagales bacterium]